jgi:hypothetical protein
MTESPEWVETPAWDERRLRNRLCEGGPFRKNDFLC